MFKLLSSLAALSVIGSASADTNGYIVDKMCAGKYNSDTGNLSPDGINVMTDPDEHSFWCLMMPSCYDSGFVLVSDGVSTPLDATADDAVRAWLDNFEDNDRNGVSKKSFTGLKATLSDTGVVSGFAWETTVAAVPRRRRLFRLRRAQVPRRVDQVQHVGRG